MCTPLAARRCALLALAFEPLRARPGRSRCRHLLDAREAAARTPGLAALAKCPGPRAGAGPARGGAQPVRSVGACVSARLVASAAGRPRATHGGRAPSGAPRRAQGRAATAAASDCRGGVPGVEPVGMGGGGAEPGPTQVPETRCVSCTRIFRDPRFVDGRRRRRFCCSESLPPEASGVRVAVAKRDPPGTAGVASPGFAALAEGRTLGSHCAGGTPGLLPKRPLRLQ